MKIIITRHGETIENKNEIMQGQLPGTLSELGIEQAKKLAERLKSDKFDYIYSSDLERAANTAKEIIKYHINTPVEFTKELRERNLGEYQGRKKEDFGLPKEQSGVLTLVPKNGETHLQLYNRGKKFIDFLLNKHKQIDTILIIAHNGFDQVLFSIIKNIKYNDNYREYLIKQEKLKNTSINIFEIDKDLS